MFHLCISTGNHSYDAYLPDGGTWNTTIMVPQTITGLKHDLVFPVRSLEGECYMRPCRGLVWSETRRADEKLLKDGMSVQLAAQTEVIGIVVEECEKLGTLMRKYRIRNREVRVGSDKGCAICQKSEYVSAFHGDFDLRSDTEAYYTDQSPYGSCINGNRIKNQRIQLRYGDVVGIGPSLRIVWLGNLLAINTPKHLDHIDLPKVERTEISAATQGIEAEGSDQSSVFQYQRAPRILEKPEEKSFKIEGPIAKNAGRETPLWLSIGPSVTSMFPMLLSSFVTGRNATSIVVMMGGTAMLAAMWGIINFDYRKKNGAIDEGKRQQVYKRYIEEMESDLMALTEQELFRLNEEFLSPERCLEMSVSKQRKMELSVIKTHRLWERMPKHADFTSVRLGRGQVKLPANISIPEDRLAMIEDDLRNEPRRLLETYREMGDAPVVIRLCDYPVVGVLGPRDRPQMLQNMVMQLAVAHSYHDVRIAILVKEDNVTQWQWAKWLPHTFGNEDRTLRMVVSAPHAIKEVLSALENIYSMRRDLANHREGEDEDKRHVPHYIIFCTDPSLLENQPIVRQILENPRGFTLVMQAPSMERLPKESGIVIQTGDQQGAIYYDTGDVTNVVYEYPDPAKLNILSHTLAMYRVNDSVENLAIPSLVTFMEIYHVRNVNDLDVWRFWNENKAWEGIKATIGLRAGSKPFVLDISDKLQSHGPHGLVAGTTGSGKSVMLQTYILSLALNYHPEQVQFLLIDYKGGGTAEVFRDLPHVAGIIDNQGEHRTIQRALQSIQGEINRRERAFKRLGVDHIDDYIQQFNADPNERTLAHLVIIVDEFAELKREQPEFMKALVSAARVGRSVGIHLILATQKPSNSVDDEIWSNTRFRICLRVAGRGDSNDMLKRPDAAYLRGMGRCYVQVGLDEIFEQVQTSYSGAEYAPDELTSEEMPHLLGDAGQPLKFKKKRKSDQETQTQMDAVLRRIVEVSAKHGVAAAHKLWLEEMKPVVLLQELKGFVDSAFDGEQWKNIDDEKITAPYALLDNVADQCHIPISLNLTDEHNDMIVAPAGAGKTAALQTVAMSLAMRYTPAQVVMYIFSMTNNTLVPLRKLPHVGELIAQDETDEALRLIKLLVAEDKRRRELFEEMNTSSYSQYNMAVRMSGEKRETLPAIVVMADRFAQLLEIVDDEMQTALFKLITESASRGIYFVVTALSLVKEEIPYKIQPSFSGVGMQLPDRDSYKQVLGITSFISAEQMDIPNYPGRGLGVIHTEGNSAGMQVSEIQIALFGSGQDYERGSLIEKMADTMQKAWKGKRAPGIVRIPKNFGAAEMYAMQDMQPKKEMPYRIPVAVDKGEGKPVCLDVLHHPSLLVCGPAKSGKTNFLLLTARSVLMAGGVVRMIGDPSNRTAQQLAETYGEKFEAIAHSNAERIAEITRELVNTMNMRAKARTDIAAIAEGSEAPKEEYAVYALLIDDLPAFVEHYQEAGQLRLVGVACSKGRDLGILIVGTTSHQEFTMARIKEPLNSMCGIRSGVMLCGKLNELNPWNISSIPLDLKRASLPVGEALYLDENGFSKIVIPTA